VDASLRSSPRGRRSDPLPGHDHLRRADQQYGGQQAGYGGQQQGWGGQQGGQQGWGGQAQPTQQWQPGADQQWGGGSQYPGLPDQQRPSGGSSKLPWILVGVVVVVLAAVGVLGFVTPGFFVTKVFDATALNDGVRTVLTNDYGLTVDNVTCPEGQRVSQGATFQCDVGVAGQPQKVTITVSNNDGAYEVSRPA